MDSTVALPSGGPSCDRHRGRIADCLSDIAGDSRGDIGFASGRGERECAVMTNLLVPRLDGGEFLQRQILPAVDRIGMEDEAARART